MNSLIILTALILLSLVVVVVFKPTFTVKTTYRIILGRRFGGGLYLSFSVLFLGMKSGSA